MIRAYETGLVQAVIVVAIVAVIAGLAQWHGWRGGPPKGRHRAPRRLHIGRRGE